MGFRACGFNASEASPGTSMVSKASTWVAVLLLRNVAT